MWRYNSTYSENRPTDRDICEMLIKEVTNNDSHFAKHTQQLELQKKDSMFDMEVLLVALEENQRLAEGLKTEAESPAKSGKGGGASAADKKSSAKVSANPAMQQQPKYSIWK